ncbi:hypothetical protein FBR02_17735 [Anaerolineae bacterium CFX9]|jgi:hypothetical protein|nr:DUF6391 domain-containing protein [Oscillatoria laete-virens]MDL1902596.1 hypothetical protein [Anaerolineae bacterium CFX9]MDL5055638.1 DUF6391 domain-containing protein [Oscillatoria laete-virens NRMC-F 0139]
MMSTTQSPSLIARFAELVQPVLELPLVRRTRRNHGLEHATIHILSGRIRGLQMAGRSDQTGFILIGEAPTEQIEWAAHEALRRMRSGEHNLAVHPNCGTNLVTTGLLAALVSSLGMAGASRREVWNRLPLITSLIMIVLVFGQPLGNSLQKHLTTDGDPADLEILGITRSQMRFPWNQTPVTVHRVRTQSV